MYFVGRIACLWRSEGMGQEDHQKFEASQLNSKFQARLRYRDPVWVMMIMMTNDNNDAVLVKADKI